jgi:NAD(P)-dependent dehydrogenase (short-subunit alcohol dehydrogenase family)
MKTIVITGSTRGIGYGLADAFLTRGSAVIISGRSPHAVDEAVARLATRHDAERIAGAPCEVTELAQLEALWSAACARFGHVDVWINNAGAAPPQVPFARAPSREVASAVATNMLGTMYGTRVALDGMLPGNTGQIFNVEGYGSDGRMMRTGMAVYGSTKTATRYFTRSVAKELEGSGVLVGTLMPGAVVTDMLVAQLADLPADEREVARRRYNIIGDTVATVAPWLADRVLANKRNGAEISWISIPKLALRFLSPGYRRRELFGDSKSRAYAPR